MRQAADSFTSPESSGQAQLVQPPVLSMRASISLKLSDSYDRVPEKRTGAPEGFMTFTHQQSLGVPYGNYTIPHLRERDVLNTLEQFFKFPVPNRRSSVFPQPERDTCDNIPSRRSGIEDTRPVSKAAFFTAAEIRTRLW